MLFVHWMVVREDEHINAKLIMNEINWTKLFYQREAIPNLRYVHCYTNIFWASEKSFGQFQTCPLSDINCFGNDHFLLCKKMLSKIEGSKKGIKHITFG